VLTSEIAEWQSSFGNFTIKVSNVEPPWFWSIFTLFIIVNKKNMIEKYGAITKNVAPCPPTKPSKCFTPMKKMMELSN
jgi:hypothetical protein